MLFPQAIALLLRTLVAAVPVELDAGQVRDLGFAGARSARWTALFADSTGDTLLVLRDGTEFARIDSARWNEVQRVRSAAAPPSLAAIRMPREEELRAWTRPRNGLQARWSLAGSRSKSSTPIGRQEVAFSLDVPWNDWVSAGLSGGTSRTYTSYAIDTVSPHPGRVWWPWWGFQACVRSVCWEVRTSDHPLPPEVWTETKIDSLLPSRDDGDLVRRWSGDPSRLEDNWQQSLSVRLGVLSWKGTWDPQGWRGTSQEAQIAPLPAGPLEWGLLVGADAEAAWTGFLVATRSRPLASRRGIELSARPAEFVFRYSNIKRLAFEIRSGFRLLPLESFP